MVVLWVVTQYGLVFKLQLFGGTYSVHLQRFMIYFHLLFDDLFFRKL